ncbi:MAG: hypothetical protein ABSF00_08815 [Candidatus Bathyarchaeia archaeon]|jgi:hypothetical protein
MKIKHVGGPPDPVVKVPKLTEKDAAEYERTRTPIVKALEKIGGYLPAVDDYYVDLIARTMIYAKKAEKFLDANTASVETYASVAYTKLKFSKIIDTAIQQLVLNRRDRLGKETQSDVINELREITQQGLKLGTQ